MNATQQREYEIWILYCNLYLLNIGGVPESADMKTFAAELWQAQTKTKAVYFVERRRRRSGQVHCFATPCRSPLGG